MSHPFASAEEFTAQTFKRVSCPREALVRKEFERCTFTRASFSETTFDHCVFRDCTFTDCTLRFAHVQGSRFTNIKFEKSDVTYVNWAEATWSTMGLINALSFTECNISHSTFFGLTLKKLVLQKCVAQNVDFADADLTQALCVETDFTESRFLNTNLTEANFTHAFGYAISPLSNTLKKARFSIPQALSLLTALEIVVVD